MSRCVKDLREMICISRINDPTIQNRLTVINEPFYKSNFDKHKIRQTNNWSNVEKIIKSYDERIQMEWLEDANQNLNKMSELFFDVSFYVHFCQFWLTKIDSTKKNQLLDMEYDIILKKINKNTPIDNTHKSLLSCIFWEYPNSVRDSYLLLSHLDVLSCQYKTETFKKLLSTINLPNTPTDVVQCCLCLRALCLSSFWFGIVTFYHTLLERKEESMYTSGIINVTPSNKIDVLISISLKYGFTSTLSYFMYKDQIPNTEYRDSNGKTLLMIAVSFNSLESVKFLLQKTNSKNTVDEVSTATGNTALQMAVCQNSLPIVQLLVDLGAANVNVANIQSDNSTPLHMAVLYGNKEVASFLLENGADVNKVTSSGATALDLAVMYEQPDLVELITKFSRQH